jgi:hypothetical protein
MKIDQTQGTWKQFVGKAKEIWGRLTDDDWKSSRESAISSLERSRNATELLVKRQNVRYPSSRETTEIEHLGRGAERRASVQ